jgi:hypothetical protein
MKKVTTINSAPRLPDWQAGADSLRRGEALIFAICDLFGIPGQGDERTLTGMVLNELAAQRSPAISIYDRKYTAHIYPEPEVSDGQVYEALRDLAAQRATDDPAMREIKRKRMLDLLDRWQAEGPPSAEDDAFWRDFHADLARTKRGEDMEAARELAARVAELEKQLAAERERADALAKALRSAEGVD